MAHKYRIKFGEVLERRIGIVFLTLISLLSIAAFIALIINVARGYSWLL